MNERDNQEKYVGMTVNERLYETGLMKEFDKACQARDRNKMIQILVKTKLTLHQAKETVDGILSMKVFEAENKFTKTEFQRDEDWDIYPKSEYKCPECEKIILFTFKDFAKHSNSDYSNLDQKEAEEIAKQFNKPEAEFNSFLDFYCPNCKSPTRVYYLFWAGGRFTHGYHLKYVVLLSKNAV